MPKHRNGKVHHPSRQKKKPHLTEDTMISRRQWRSGRKGGTSNNTWGISTQDISQDKEKWW